MEDIVVVEAVRTATGRFGGMFADVAAVKLAEVSLKELLHRGGISPEHIDEVIMGMVYQGGAGANPARQVSIGAGLPYEVSALTINQLCGSGLRAVGLAWESLSLKRCDLVVAGGMENMSQIPFVLPNFRWGNRLGHSEVKDLMLTDGLWDCFYDCHMGVTAENLASKYKVTREEQDNFALRSQKRWALANSKGFFSDEIVPVEVNSSGVLTSQSKDEHPRPRATIEDLEQLKPAFMSNGTVTAGNAAGINDGAAILLMMRDNTARSTESKPLVYLRDVVSVGVDPKIMGIGPAPAICKLLDQNGMSLSDIGRFEINEAFAAQSLAVGRELRLDWNSVNVLGGGIAMGHAVGASGARIATTLIYEMLRSRKRFGVAALCVGGGMGVAALFELY
ncbi:MAG: acetyl-CoA C-acetyltransferase [Candidatus Latescibacterota bacterium]|nr:acetyl-CoA C-acetyltransferase [Candidatus Latescibacterota bacterium]